MEEGKLKFDDVVRQIQEMVAENDPAVLEITNEMSDLEKHFLRPRLSDFEVARLKKLKEEAGE